MNKRQGRGPHLKTLDGVLVMVPDVRRNLAEGRSDIVQRADALFVERSLVERSLTSPDRADRLPAHEVVSVGLNASGRESASTPDSEVHVRRSENQAR